MDSETNFSGIIVLPLIIYEGTASFTGWPFTYATVCPMVRLMIVSSLVAVTVLVRLSQSILAPSCSNIALMGTIVVHF